MMELEGYSKRNRLRTFKLLLIGTLVSIFTSAYSNFKITN